MKFYVDCSTFGCVHTCIGREKGILFTMMTLLALQVMEETWSSTLCLYVDVVSMVILSHVDELGLIGVE